MCKQSGKTPNISMQKQRSERNNEKKCLIIKRNWIIVPYNVFIVFILLLLLSLFVAAVVVVVVIRILCTFQEINKKKQAERRAQRPSKFAQNESRESAQKRATKREGEGEREHAWETLLGFMPSLSLRVLLTFCGVVKRLALFSSSRTKS